MRKGTKSQKEKRSNVTMGLDLSLTSTGVIVLDGDKIIFEKIIKSKPVGSRPLDELVRIVDIVDTIRSYVVDYVPSIVAIEGMAFMAKNTTALVQLAALNYMTRNVLAESDIRFIIVAPTTLKKFVTGKGNAQKDMMMLDVYKRWGVSLLDNNTNDAYGLARIAQVIDGDLTHTTKEQREGLELLVKQI